MKDATKDALIQGLVDARRKVLQAAQSLLPQQRDEVFLGVWSAKDLLAHLAGWDATYVQAVQEILAGKRPTFFQHKDQDWQSYNTRLVAQYRRDDWAELLAVLEESQHALIGFLQTIPAESYVQHRSIGRLLRGDVKDGEEHARQLDAFRRGGPVSA